MQTVKISNTDAKLIALRLLTDIGVKRIRAFNSNTSNAYLNAESCESWKARGGYEEFLARVAAQRKGEEEA